MNFLLISAFGIAAVSAASMPASKYLRSIDKRSVVDRDVKTLWDQLAAGAEHMQVTIAEDSTAGSEDPFEEVFLKGNWCKNKAEKKGFECDACGTEEQDGKTYGRYCEKCCDAASAASGSADATATSTASGSADANGQRTTRDCARCCSRDCEKIADASWDGEIEGSEYPFEEVFLKDWCKRKAEKKGFECDVCGTEEQDGATYGKYCNNCCDAASAASGSDDANGQRTTRDCASCSCDCDCARCCSRDCEKIADASWDGEIEGSEYPFEEVFLKDWCKRKAEKKGFECDVCGTEEQDGNTYKRYCNDCCDDASAASGSADANGQRTKRDCASCSCDCEKTADDTTTTIADAIATH